MFLNLAKHALDIYNEPCKGVTILIRKKDNSPVNSGVSKLVSALEIEEEWKYAPKKNALSKS